MSGEFIHPPSGRGAEPGEQVPQDYEALLAERDEWRERAITDERTLANTQLSLEAAQAQAKEADSLREQLNQKTAELSEARRQIGGLQYALVRGQLEQQAERATSQSVQKFLERVASTDPLTGLANRRAFEDSFEQYVYQVHAHNDTSQPGAIALVDLDKFKDVNDSAGHDSGDRLLIEVADKLGRLTRSQDLVARVGGDEFAVIIRRASKEECQEVVNRLLHALDDTQPIGDAGIIPTLSIGVSYIEQEDADDIYRQADQSLYQAKAEGRNQVVFFEAGA